MADSFPEKIGYNLPKKQEELLQKRLAYMKFAFAFTS